MPSPLRMSLLLVCFVVLLPVTTPSQESVADAARKNRAKDQTATKRVWTNDDVASASSPEPTAPKKETRESVSATLESFRLLDKYELGVGVLRMAGAPDVDFPNRREWEQKLLDAKQAWIDQVDRMVAHKDTSQASQEEELRLAIGKKRIFERIEAEGIEQARAQTDPVTKAHLAYKRQLENCTGATGKFRDWCDESLEQMRSKMQREGIW
jgi:hypothetical protein